MPLLLLDLPQMVQSGGDLNIGLIAGLVIMGLGAVVSCRQNSPVKAHPLHT